MLEKLVSRHVLLLILFTFALFSVYLRQLCYFLVIVSDMENKIHLEILNKVSGLGEIVRAGREYEKYFVL